MSRLLTGAVAASVGSFVIHRGAKSFSPAFDAGLQPGNDLDPAPRAQETIHRIQDEAYAQGYEDARRAADQELAEEREALRRLAVTLEVLRPEPTNALALLLAETVDRLVRDICGEVEVDATLLLARARAAAALIGENVQPSKLRLHPEDARLLADADLPVEIVPDPSLVRGNLRLETGNGWVEDGPEIRLERLRAELDRMGAKP